MNILVIDDHQLFAAGLQHMLKVGFNGASVENYPNPQDAIDQHSGEAIELIVLDFYIPGFDTIAYIQEFSRRFEGVKIVVISSSISRSDRQDCLNAGATAYFEKHLPPEVVLSQLQKLLTDNKADENLSFVDRQNNQYGLGPKKTEVLILLARGYSNKKIATRLGVSPETVKTHIADIYRAINVKSRDEASDWATEHGFI